MVETPEIQGDAALNCDAAGVLYTVESTTGYSYEWTVPEGADFTGQGTDSIWVDFNSNFGWITVTAISDNGCMGETTDLEVQCVTALEKLSLAGINLYPNPVTDGLTITLSKENTPTSICFYNAQGQLVLCDSELQPQTVYFDLKDWTAGIYFCHITTTEHTFVARVVRN